MSLRASRQGCILFEFAVKNAGSQTYDWKNKLVRRAATLCAFALPQEQAPEPP
jgi:hypothetical protein